MCPIFFCRMKNWEIMRNFWSNLRTSEFEFYSVYKWSVDKMYHKAPYINVDFYLLSALIFTVNGQLQTSWLEETREYTWKSSDTEPNSKTPCPFSVRYVNFLVKLMNGLNFWIGFNFTIHINTLFIWQQRLMLFINI